MWTLTHLTKEELVKCYRKFKKGGKIWMIWNYIYLNKAGENIYSFSSSVL